LTGEKALQDRTGQDRTGQDRTGQDRTGQDRTGQEERGTGQDIKLTSAGDRRDRREKEQETRRWAN
jgi:hypothetical protein